MHYFNSSIHAQEIWQQLGQPVVYAEPFIGSLDVLLANQPCDREIVCDKNGLLVNFYRAATYDMQSIIDHLQQIDISNYHNYIIQWSNDYAEYLSKDPLVYNCKAAAHWLYAIKHWYNDTCCSALYQRQPDNQISLTQFPDPQLQSKVRISDQEFITQLRQRMQQIFIINRDWQSGVTDMVLMQSDRKKRTVGIFFDPPMNTDVIQAVYTWMVDNEDRYRIAFCNHSNLPLPEDWYTVAANIYYSPACRTQAQQLTQQLL